MLLVPTEARVEARSTYQSLKKASRDGQKLRQVWKPKARVEGQSLKFPLHWSPRTKKRLEARNTDWSKCMSKLFRSWKCLTQLINQWPQGYCWMSRSLTKIQLYYQVTVLHLWVASGPLPASGLAKLIMRFRSVRMRWREMYTNWTPSLINLVTLGPCPYSFPCCMLWNISDNHNSISTTFSRKIFLISKIEYSRRMFWLSSLEHTGPSEKSFDWCRQDYN